MATKQVVYTCVGGVMAWGSLTGNHKIVVDLNAVWPGYKSAPEFDQTVYEFGIKNKVDNAGALPTDKETGKPQPVSARFAAMGKVATAISSREWSVDRESANVNLLLTALYRAFPKGDAKKLGDDVSRMKPEEVTAMIKDPPKGLKPILDAIQAERVKSLNINTAALFEKLSRM